MKPTFHRNASNETSRFMEDLQGALKTRKKNARYFAELKLESYEEAEELPSGLRIMKTKTTEGEFGKMGKPLSVRYVGYLANGRIFDSGLISFNLGRGEVIKAWDIALKQLKVGEEATLFCPSAIAYGRHGSGKEIKPYTTLIFDVTLESVSE